MSKEELLQMAFMALFWAALVVLLSAVFGYGAPAGGGSGITYGHGITFGGSRHEIWDGSGVHRNLEGIWDAARMAR